MWFKNLFFYRFTKPFNTDLTTLETALSEACFKPITGQEPSSSGWTPPIDMKDAPFVHPCGKYWMIALKKREKVLPASVVNEYVAEKVSEIESTQHRKVSRKEKAELKEQVTAELLPKAFSKTSKHYAYLCPESRYMVLNTSSPKLADELTSQLRQAVGSLPIRVPAVNSAPASIMTAWLGESLTPPAGLTLNEESELISTGEDKASVKYKGMSVAKEHIEQNQALGFLVKRQALTWDDKISFVLGDDLTVKRVKFLDVIQDQLDDIHAEDAAAKFDAGFSLMAAEVDVLFPLLLDAFDGEDESALVE